MKNSNKKTETKLWAKWKKKNKKFFSNYRQGKINESLYTSACKSYTRFLQENHVDKKGVQHSLKTKKARFDTCKNIYALVPAALNALLFKELYALIVPNSDNKIVYLVFVFVFVLTNFIMFIEGVTDKQAIDFRIEAAENLQKSQIVKVHKKRKEA